MTVMFEMRRLRDFRNQRSFGRRRRTISLIAGSELFDTSWYLSQNPELVRADVNPVLHYIDHGASEGLDPHPLFDTDWYLLKNPDVGCAKINPLAHYIMFGAREGRNPHPLFDTKWYVSRHRNFNFNNFNPLSHYVSDATTSIDPHPLFDTAWYLFQYPDVGTSDINPLVHYVVHGAIERRNPHPLFDTGWYLDRNPDVALERNSPLAHYVAQGASEGRNPHPLFDGNWYLLQNPDVAEGKHNPLVHYMTCGAREGRDPHPLFSTAWYYAHNPTRKKSCANPLLNYLFLGRDGTYPHPLFDTQWYLAQNPDVALSYFSPLTHYILHGAAEARDPNPLFDTDWYFAQDPAIAAGSLNPLAHYVTKGAFGEHQPNWWFESVAYCALHPDVSRSSISPLVHCLLTGKKASRRRDVAFDAANSAFKSLSEMEPEMLLSLSDIKNLKYLTGQARSVKFAVWRKLFYSFETTYHQMVFLPSLNPGGRNCDNSDLFQALREMPIASDTLLIVTDDTNVSHCPSPPNITLRIFSDLYPGLSAQDRMELCAILIYQLQPEAVLNLNSSALWRAIAQNARSLSRATELYAHIPDCTSNGQSIGLAEHSFRSCIQYLTMVFVDNASLPKRLTDICTLPDELLNRFYVLPTPSESCAVREMSSRLNIKSAHRGA